MGKWDRHMPATEASMGRRIKELEAQVRMANAAAQKAVGLARGAIPITESYLWKADLNYVPPYSELFSINVPPGARTYDLYVTSSATIRNPETTAQQLDLLLITTGDDGLKYTGQAATIAPGYLGCASASVTYAAHVPDGGLVQLGVQASAGSTTAPQADNSVITSALVNFYR